MILLLGEWMNDSKFRDISLIILTVLVVYFPAITGVVNSIDDVHIIKAYSVSGQRTLQSILIPRDQFYFRPFVELSYYLDNLFWGLEPRVMHLENILLHLLNAILIYLVASRVNQIKMGTKRVPLLSALLFSLHPINTEAICWIAGRTDPIAGLFILLSLYLLLKFIQSGSLLSLTSAFTAMLLAFLSKEVALMLLPVSIGLLIITRLTSQEETNVRWKYYFSITLYASFGLLLAGYVVARLISKTGASETTLEIWSNHSFDLWKTLFIALTTLGFYAKKLFIPLPLNFAIDSVSGWYFLPGIMVVFYVIYCSSKMSIAQFFGLSGVIFILPAIFVRLAEITWTPVAERYLYIPSMFFSIAAVTLLFDQFNDALKSLLVRHALVGVIAVLALITFNRNEIWRNNLSLYQDTVLKSPTFGDIHNELGMAFLRNNQLDKARYHFQIASKLSTRPLIKEFAEMNLLLCDLHDLSLQDTRIKIGNYISRHNDTNVELLLMLRGVLEEILQTENKGARKTELVCDIIELNNKIYDIDKDPHCYYRNGQLFLLLGKRQEALQYFQKVIHMSPQSSYYLKPAQKLVYLLERQ